MKYFIYTYKYLQSATVSEMRRHWDRFCNRVPLHFCVADGVAACGFSGALKVPSASPQAKRRRDLAAFRFGHAPISRERSGIRLNRLGLAANFRSRRRDRRAPKGQVRSHDKSRQDRDNRDQNALVANSPRFAICLNGGSTPRRQQRRPASRAGEQRPDPAHGPPTRAS